VRPDSTATITRPARKIARSGSDGATPQQEPGAVREGFCGGAAYGTGKRREEEGR